MKRAVIVLSLVILFAGGVFIWWRLRPEKVVVSSCAACPPVRTTLAILALVENPTARTFAVQGAGADVFTNLFLHANLVSETDASSSVELIFLSGETSPSQLKRAWERCATNGLLAVHFNVRHLPFTAFRRHLDALPSPAWRLWFPGRADALVTIRKSATPPRLADQLDLFAREGLFADLTHAGIDSLASLFASYVGASADVLPAFDYAVGETVPECFVTREIPAFDWIDCAAVDADIREPLLAEMRSFQVVRRLVLQGDMAAREGRQDAAMEAWTKAIRRHPNDPLVLERICLLDVNAETFLKVGNFPMAAQCLETMVCLRPKDVSTARRLARVLNQMGKTDLAAAVSQRADELMKAELIERRGKK